MQDVFRLRKRISKADMSQELSACWSVVEIPSLLVFKSNSGEWALIMDRVWMLADEQNAPDHVRFAAEVEKRLSGQTFSSRREALESVQAICLISEFQTPSPRP